MSDPVRFHWFNLATQDATDIAASDVNSQYPISNLKSHFSSDVFRTASASGSVVLDFKTTELINAILVKPSFEGFKWLGDLTVELNATDEWTSPAYTATITPDHVHGLGLHYPATDQNYRFCRLSGSGLEYFELASVFVGSYYQPAKNISLGWKYENVDLSKSKENRYGQVYKDIVRDKVKISADVKWLTGTDATATELQDWNEFINYCGVTEPFWMVMDNQQVFSYDRELFAGQFFFDKRPALANLKFNYYNSSLRLSECY